jgi:hypothetical protein
LLRGVPFHCGGSGDNPAIPLAELRIDWWASACSAFTARGRLQVMPRAAAVACALGCLGYASLGYAGLGCSSEDYVIGRFADGGVGECAGRIGALVCSGFERADLADWSDTRLEEQGAVERTSERVHGGHGALHASSNAKASVGVVAADFAALRGGALHFRAYLYVPAELPTETINIFFVGDDPTPDPFSGVDFNLESGAVQIYSPASNPQRQMGTLTIPRDRWFCFRARIGIDDTQGEVDAYIDNELALHAGALDTLPDQGVHLFRAGVDWSSEQDAFFEIYMDDVLVDRMEAPCR